MTTGPSTSKSAKSTAPDSLVIFYDGACHLCSREIVKYRDMDHRHRLKFVNIAAPSFSATAYHLDATQVNKRLHVMVNGHVYQGVDAFIEIWKQFSHLRFLSKVVSLPGIYQLATLGYAMFATVRVYLPKRKGTQCDLN